VSRSVTKPVRRKSCSRPCNRAAEIAVRCTSKISSRKLILEAHNEELREHTSMRIIIEIITTVGRRRISSLRTSSVLQHLDEHQATLHRDSLPEDLSSGDLKSCVPGVGPESPSDPSTLLVYPQAIYGHLGRLGLLDRKKQHLDAHARALIYSCRRGKSELLACIQRVTSFH